MLGHYGMTLEKFNSSTLIELYWYKRSSNYANEFQAAQTRAIMFMVDNCSMAKSRYSTPSDIFHLPLIDGEKVIKEITEDDRKRAHEMHQMFIDQNYKPIEKK